MRKGIREMTNHELTAAREAGEITASACVVEQERRAAAASPPPVVEGWTLDRVMLKPGAALEELLYYKGRVQELLETTNRYLERARAAEVAPIAAPLVWSEFSKGHHTAGTPFFCYYVGAQPDGTAEFDAESFPSIEAAKAAAQADYDGRINDAVTRMVRPAASFQARVHPWMTECFGADIAGDKLERGDRLLEEVFELLQSGGYPRERIRALEGYVHSRPAGDPRQEVGGVMVTLAAYCLAHGLDMHDAGEVELTRIWTKVDAIRTKQAAKPTGSALPIPKEKPAATIAVSKEVGDEPNYRGERDIYWTLSLNGQKLASYTDSHPFEAPIEECSLPGDLLNDRALARKVVACLTGSPMTTSGMQAAGAELVTIAVELGPFDVAQNTSVGDIKRGSNFVDDNEGGDTAVNSANVSIGGDHG